MMIEERSDQLCRVLSLIDQKKRWKSFLDESDHMPLRVGEQRKGDSAGNLDRWLDCLATQSLDLL